MPRYYVNANAQSNGDHEVHKDDCNWLMLVTNRHDLGYHPSCQSAVTAAKLTFPKSNGCYWCANACHTT